MELRERSMVRRMWHKIWKSILENLLRFYSPKYEWLHGACIVIWKCISILEGNNRMIPASTHLNGQFLGKCLSVTDTHVLLFWVTNDHRCSSLKEHTWIISHFCGPGMWAWLSWGFSLGVTDLQSPAAKQSCVLSWGLAVSSRDTCLLAGFTSLLLGHRRSLFSGHHSQLAASQSFLPCESLIEPLAAWQPGERGRIISCPREKNLLIWSCVSQKSLWEWQLWLKANYIFWPHFRAEARTGCD